MPPVSPEFVCIWMRLSTLSSAQKNICTHVHMFICIYVYVYIHTYIYIYVCVYVCMYIHMCIHTCIYVNIYTYGSCVCMYVCIYIYIYRYTYIPQNIWYMAAKVGGCWTLRDLRLQAVAETCFASSHFRVDAWFGGLTNFSAKAKQAYRFHTNSVSSCVGIHDKVSGLFRVWDL